MKSLKRTDQLQGLLKQDDKDTGGQAAAGESGESQAVSVTSEVFTVKKRNERDRGTSEPVCTCYSYTGNQQSGKQQLSIGSGCDVVESVQHEFLHALGFYHEQSRSDRNDYVTIEKANIKHGNEHNLDSFSDKVSSFLNVPYDYTSIMHYDKTAFQRGSLPTIIPKKPQYLNIIGKQMDFSERDTLKLNRLYNCTSSLTFLDSCSFEYDDICGMLQSTTGATDWQRLSGGSGGPSSDHTFLGQKQGTGYFMHFNTSTVSTGNEAILESRLFYPKKGYQCLEFFYYHSGSDSDQLNIWIKEYTAVSPNGILKLMDTVSGKPADYWQLHFSSLNATDTFRVVFQVIKGDGNSVGGISVDDINLSETQCPENVWHIRNFGVGVAQQALLSPPFYSKDGYAYQIGLLEYNTKDVPYNLAAYLFLITGANDQTLQWPCPWRQATIEFMDQNPNIQQRTSNMKSITTDPNQLSSDQSYLLWDNPADVGFSLAYPNGTFYTLTGGDGKLMFSAEESLHSRDFMKGGDAFILISMEDISHLEQSQPLPQPASPTSPVSSFFERPVLCEQNICSNNGVCVIENQMPVCRCVTSGSWWYVGDWCENRVPSKGNNWTMSSLSVLIALFTASFLNIA
ncbi:meprin A subunit beta-like [Hyperolius riggenbachi]|uniref:meprin A subunit beta-like n=1 Tax=Hyperolius riggenbachi TaxID=752182 RepID=UPI0035A263F8